MPLASATNTMYNEHSHKGRGKSIVSVKKRVKEPNSLVGGSVLGESCRLARVVLVVMPESDVAGGREMEEGERASEVSEADDHRCGRGWARVCSTAGAGCK